MKKYKYIISITLMMLAMSSCELDNFDGPNAAVFGGIYDKDTGKLIEQEIGTKGESSKLTVIEYGYSTRNPQGWRIQTTGEYRNNLVFSGTYDIILNKGNFIALDTLKKYKIGRGNNKLDFHVTPNIRIKSPKVEKVGGKIVATCKLEFANPVATGLIESLGLYAQADRFPGKYFNKVNKTISLESEGLSFANKSTYASRTFTVELDLTNGDGASLTPGRTYFFRIGATPKNLGEGIIALPNYSPVVSIAL